MSYWRQPRGPMRRRTLTPAKLADAAVDVLDGEGEQALSMRRVADVLDVVPSSLYGHVRGRDDLCDLALDRALERDLGGLLSAAEKDAAEVAVAWFDHLTRHPWAASFVLERTPLGPAYLTLADVLCRLVSAAGVPPADVLGRAYAITAMVAGHAVAHHNARHRDAAGYDDVELSDVPHLAGAVADSAGDWSAVVRQGVQALLGTPAR
ncbi:TetR/AcrR family transcriptional regulator [Saccharomonospora azurea]|uniref:TetR/AcrR family transcriptional regulator n=1 Tax=Saccharomonospora azurea TaxID=40988 RepID=UPI003D924A5B